MLTYSVNGEHIVAYAHTQPRTVLLSVIVNTENRHQYEKAFT